MGLRGLMIDGASIFVTTRVRLTAGALVTALASGLGLRMLGDNRLLVLDRESKNLVEILWEETL